MKLLKIADVADTLGISTRAVYRLLADGQLPGAKIGGCLRVDANDLADYITRQKDDFSLQYGFFVSR